MSRTSAATTNTIASDQYSPPVPLPMVVVIALPEAAGVGARAASPA
jgi:hypothetical protein